MIPRDRTIQIMCDKGYSLRQISNNINVKYDTVRSICRRNNFNYIRSRKGRPLEAYDKKSRIRTTRPKTIYGSRENNIFYDIDKAIQEIQEFASTEITKNNVNDFE
jgi:IS30 family transposase